MNYFNIYLAGAMACCDSYDEMNDWRRELTHALGETIDVCNQYYGCDMILKVVNPCLFYNFENPRHQSELEVMRFDLSHVKKSDLIIVGLNKINQSIGTAMELYEASNREIPVIGYDPGDEYDDIHPWLQCCITRVEKDKHSLMNYLIDFYFWG